MARTVSATGTLAAEDQVVLGAKVVGRLSEISVDLGSRVRKGQPIARIDPNDYRLRVDQAAAALQQARVRLGLPPEGSSDNIVPEETAVVRQAAALLKDARLTHDRMAKLWGRKFIARAELDTAVSQLAVAEGRYQDAIEEVRNRQGVIVQRRSELEIARQQFADTIIVSPMDGAVSERQGSVGQYLSAGAPVVTLVRIDPLRLRLAVPEREAGAVNIGQTVELTVEGDPTKTRRSCGASLPGHRREQPNFIDRSGGAEWTWPASPRIFREGRHRGASRREDRHGTGGCHHHFCGNRKGDDSD